MFVRFVRADGGATAIEYALVASLVSIFVLVGIQAVGQAVHTDYQEVSAGLQ